MILSALLSFLGGSAFRAIFGEVSAWVQKKQDHAHEMERLKLEGELDAQKAERELQRLQVQHELGVKEIEVKGDIDLSKLDAEAFVESMKERQTPSGIKWVDAWNATIRPQWAEVALALWIFKLYVQGFAMDEFDLSLLGVIAGWFFAARELAKRGR